MPTSPVQDRHRGLLPKKCRYCERRFSKAEHLKRHQRSRTLSLGDVLIDVTNTSSLLSGLNSTLVTLCPLLTGPKILVNDRTLVRVVTKASLGGRPSRSRRSICDVVRIGEAGADFA